MAMKSALLLVVIALAGCAAHTGYSNKLDYQTAVTVAQTYSTIEATKSSMVAGKVPITDQTKAALDALVASYNQTALAYCGSQRGDMRKVCAKDSYHAAAAAVAKTVTKPQQAALDSDLRSLKAKQKELVKVAGRIPKNVPAPVAAAPPIPPVAGVVAVR